MERQPSMSTESSRTGRTRYTSTRDTDPEPMEMNTNPTSSRTSSNPGTTGHTSSRSSNARPKNPTSSDASSNTESTRRLNTGSPTTTTGTGIPTTSLHPHTSPTRATSLIRINEAARP